MNRQVPPHYIRKNEAARVPSRLIIMDSEALTDRSSSGEVQRWRCGAAMFVHWTSKGNIHRTVRSYDHAEELWADITSFTRKRQRTVLYAHNLPYDLRITQALSWLPRAGFELTAIRIASQGAWSKWARGTGSLTLCDSASLFPVTVHTLGRFLGTPKLPLPENSDHAAWKERCIRDVEILGATMVEYFRWLKTGVAGNWQVTGAGQSWAHWKHMHYTHPVLVHDDASATEAERRAMWTGRAESWQWGKDITAPVFEWDWQNAYPRIVRDRPIPVKLVGNARGTSIRDLQVLMNRWIVLADVTVTTDRPLVPAKHEGRILWPVGTFDTTLWQPELELLLDAGATIRVTRVWLYKGEPALASWADWILRELHERSAGRPRWAGVLLKHWSRTLIGRFATRWQDWELLGHDPVERVMTGRMHNVDTGEDSEFMQIGHDVHIMTGLVESDDSCPQVTSYVMSLARQQLWEAIQAAGEQNVLYIDTDSLVVNVRGNERMKAATRAGRFPGLRLKGSHSGYEIYGPRAAIIGGETKLAGIPRGAVRTSETQWIGEVWTQFERAIATGEHDRVTIGQRKYTIRWNEFRRARCAGGRTAPYALPGYVPRRRPGEPEPTTISEKVKYTRRALARNGRKHSPGAHGISSHHTAGTDSASRVETS